MYLKMSCDDAENYSAANMDLTNPWFWLGLGISLLVLGVFLGVLFYH
jgi:hypothetical protein